MGTRLFELRHKLGLSQEAVAAEADLSLDGYRKLEKGLRYGRKETHARLAKALNTSVSYIVNGAEGQDVPVSFFDGLNHEQIRFLMTLKDYFIAKNEGRIPAEGLPTSPEVERRTREMAEKGEIEEEINMTVL